jgi:hypothetical protein
MSILVMVRCVWIKDGYLVSNTDLRVRGYTSPVLDTFGNIERF